MVTRYRIRLSGPIRSKRPPMLGGPDCPPKNVTERSRTPPSLARPLQVPDSSRAGGVTLNRKSTLKLRESSPYKARTSRSSPSRVPFSDLRANVETSCAPPRSSTGLVARDPQPVRITRLTTAQAENSRNIVPVQSTRSEPISPLPGHCPTLGTGQLTTFPRWALARNTQAARSGLVGAQSLNDIDARRSHRGPRRRDHGGREENARSSGDYPGLGRLNRVEDMPCQPL